MKAIDLRIFVAFAFSAFLHTGIGFAQDDGCPPVAVGNTSPCIDKLHFDQAQEAQKEAAAKLAVQALVPQVKAVNGYYQLIPTAASFTTDAKSFFANYLADNNSVSSIPRNLKSLGARHKHWMTSLSSSLDAYAPKFATIVDGPSYQAVLTSIVAFQATCHDDAALSAAERHFVSDLLTLQDALTALEQRGTDLSASLNDPVFSGIGDQTLPGSVDQTVSALSSYSTEIGASRQEILQQGAKRAGFCGQISVSWQAAAGNQLKLANATTADNLISDIQAALRGPQFYATVIATTSNALGDIDEAVGSDYSPIHGQRALFAAQALLPKLRKSLADASIGSDMSTQASAAIDQFAQDLVSRTSSVSDGMSRRTALGAERQRLVKMALMHNATTMSGDCSSLALKITGLKANADTVDSEDRYLQFIRNCRKH